MIPRMRTVAGTLELIRQEDPGTQITAHYIRQIFKSGAVQVVHNGRKILANADEVMAFIASGASLPTQPAEDTRTGVIRRIV